MNAADNTTDDGEILLKAAEKALGLMGLMTGEQRYQAHDYTQPQLINIVEVWKRLSSSVSNDPELVAHWVNTSNKGLGATPAVLLRTQQGSARVLAYLNHITDK